MSFCAAAGARRRAGSLLAAAAAGAVAFAAFAAPAGAHTGAAIKTCKPVTRGFALSVRVRGASCRTAAAVERYASAQTWSQMRVGSRTWKGTVYSHAHHHSYLLARSGRMTVWITVAQGTQPAAGIGSGEDDGLGCGYTGEVDFFPARVNPGNFIDANGRLLATQVYPELYAVMGTRFGSSSDGGYDSFALPTIAAPAGLHAMVCIYGRTPASESPNDESGPVCPVGKLKLFSQSDPVYGYLPANGGLVKVARRPTLAGYLGSRFGGDGVTTFATPNLPAPAGMTWQICASASDGAGDVSPVLSEVSYWARSPWAGPLSVRWEVPTSGEVLVIAQYTALYALLGTDFGGNGKSTFALPTVASPAPGLQAAIAMQGVYPQPS